MAEKKKIMYVCFKNASRSQMAEVLTKIELESQNIQGWEVESSGLNAAEVNGSAIEVLREIGGDVNGLYSKPISNYEANSYQHVISFCGPNSGVPEQWASKQTFEDWLVDNPSGSLEDFRKVRDDIAAKVKQFVSTLKN
eukprot:TRINITY_DN714_c0_g3_i2.p1 TRINITY_DN714_c0_g3~~TRINITY_DN714_c0_g3_i2.p1  ORF type:complete len:139 (-),score=75.13 TRINITY_DN714_c0_g3_i2:70-486(-)